MMEELSHYLILAIGRPWEKTLGARHMIEHATPPFLGIMETGRARGSTNYM